MSKILYQQTIGFLRVELRESDDPGVYYHLSLLRHGQHIRRQNLMCECGKPMPRFRAENFACRLLLEAYWGEGGDR